MPDLDDLFASLRDGAERRSLPVVDAMFLEEPTFAIDSERTSVEEALDLAQRMLAPFISITVDIFNAEVFLAEFDEAAPDDVIALARERDGELQGLSMRWFGLGATALFLAAADWAAALNAHQSAWAEQQRAAWADERDTRAVRVAHLASRIEQDPRYRTASQNQRKVVGRLVADELTTGDDDAITLKWALEGASKALRENAAAAYLPIPDAIDEVADELRGNEDWKKSRTARERDATARAFLLAKTGYAPASALVELLARHAFTWR